MSNDAQGLQHLRLDEVSDARLGHDRDRDLGDDAVDHVGVGGARHTAVAADVRRHALERHDRDGAGVLGDARLLRGDDVHDDAALQHVRQAALDAIGASALVVAHGMPRSRSEGSRRGRGQVAPAYPRRPK